jgi:3-carboxy-cis,cis-muconate cycloisomerase
MRASCRGSFARFSAFGAGYAHAKLRSLLFVRFAMPATAIDSSIFGNLFSDARLRDIWSDESRTAKYLLIEKALAKVQGTLGIIPQNAADEIQKRCDLSIIDWEKLRTKTETAGSPIIPVVNQLVAACNDGLGEFAHWGATTQDIMDTATVLQIKECLALIEHELSALSASLAALAKKHRDTPVIGRSALQQAIPVTFGYKMATILASVERHRERLSQLRPRVLVGEFGGACGTLASIESGALDTQAALMRELGLGEPLIAWHSARDTIAEVGAFCGVLGGTLGKIAMDVKLMMQSEVGEVAEPFTPGRGGSSTMPQKRNPISCLFIHANVSVIRQHAALLMEAMVGDHERSSGPWHIEWMVLPEMFALLGGALKHANFIMAGLEINESAMQRNLAFTQGLVMSEAVMMGLGRAMGRERAHDIVYDLCRDAVTRQRPLLDLLCEHAEISKHATRAQLEAMMNPANYLGKSGVMVDRVLAVRKG